MHALTVIPGRAGSVEWSEVPEPAPAAGAVRVATQALGICGTDREIAGGVYGWAPPGKERLVLGHESVGIVLEAPGDSGLSAGDWVVAMVRRPDPVPCVSCAAGEWDMCRNGRYTEHGIKELDGFGRECFLVAPDALVRVPRELGRLAVLVEPTSVVAKAWEHTERLARRSGFTPQRVLVAGAGPIGLLAALLGVQRGLEVHVLDRVTDGVKPELVRALGATYHMQGVEAAGGRWDAVFECTGAPGLLFDVIRAAAPNGIVCLTGVSSGGRRIAVDAGALNREIVLENNVVFGSVSANRRHYAQAADSLARAPRGWLARLITRELSQDRWREALDRDPNGIKSVLVFGARLGALEAANESMSDGLAASQELRGPVSHGLETDRAGSSSPARPGERPPPRPPPGPGQKPVEPPRREPNEREPPRRDPLPDEPPRGDPEPARRIDDPPPGVG